MFSPKFQKIIREANRDFLQQAPFRVGKKILAVALSGLEKPITGANKSEFSKEVGDYYLTKTKLPFKYDTTAFWEHFENIGMVEKQVRKENNYYVPTGYGILLFGI